MHANTTPQVRTDPAGLAAALAGAAPTAAIAADLTHLATTLAPVHADAASRDKRDLRTAQSPNTSPTRLAQLASHSDPVVVRAVVANPSTPLDVVEQLHQQLLATDPVAATCTIARLGPARWLTDALAAGYFPNRIVLTRLCGHLQDPVAGADTAPVVVMASADDSLHELRRALGEAATRSAHVSLPGPDELPSGHVIDYVRGMLDYTHEWADHAADWFAAAAAPGLSLDQLPSSIAQGTQRSLSPHQVATLKAVPCPASYSMLLSSYTAEEHVSPELVTTIVDLGLPRLSTELIRYVPQCCTTSQLDTAIRIANLANVHAGPVLKLPASADLPGDALLMLLERAETDLWGLWLAGKLPAQPTRPLVDAAVTLPRFTRNSGNPNAEPPRKVMAEQVGHELVAAAGNSPVPPAALSVLEGLGSQLLAHAAARAGQNLYAAALAAWCTRELGDDPRVWTSFVRLSGTVNVDDLDTLAMVARATLENPAVPA